MHDLGSCPRIAQIDTNGRAGILQEQTEGTEMGPEPPGGPETTDYVTTDHRTLREAGVRNRKNGARKLAAKERTDRKGRNLTPSVPEVLLRSAESLVREFLVFGIVTGGQGCPRSGRRMHKFAGPPIYGCFPCFFEGS